MLVDYISPDRLPWVVVWLDWWRSRPHHSFSGLGLALFVGACLWVVYCAVRYGYAVG